MLAKQRHGAFARELRGGLVVAVALVAVEAVVGVVEVNRQVGVSLAELLDALGLPSWNVNVGYGDLSSARVPGRVGASTLAKTF